MATTKPIRSKIHDKLLCKDPIIYYLTHLNFFHCDLPSTKTHCKKRLNFQEFGHLFWWRVWQTCFHHTPVKVLTITFQCFKFVYI